MPSYSTGATEPQAIHRPPAYPCVCVYHPGYGIAVPYLSWQACQSMLYVVRVLAECARSSRHENVLWNMHARVDAS